MLRKMQAEIMFLNPNDVNCGIAKLIECDFDTAVRDEFDDYGPAVFITAWAHTGLNESDFFDWTENVVQPFGGEVLEAGLADHMASEATKPVARRAWQL